MLAISRLYLDNFAHLQASWLTPGLKMGQLALFYGCDDMGGTIIEERVVHDAGSTNEATRRDLENIIVSAGFQPGDPRHVLEPAPRNGARNSLKRSRRAAARKRMRKGLG